MSKLTKSDIDRNLELVDRLRAKTADINAVVNGEFSAWGARALPDEANALVVEILTLHQGRTSDGIRAHAQQMRERSDLLGARTWGGTTGGPERKAEALELAAVILDKHA